ncbi:hypothetical protein ASPVEDRAFT_374904 [Aspergillus versicolor CBS 583.65]|uniref:Uncharacterized protein n=1 Tax=Aspergillus versicolor CBS 583.65 TaxID=1036611 RepID=A0A1L9Q248_ASPVE|nr:uncharacterized protein ASPVEDRAFT_374904 [Aspergillus versicolor CBS 583.65]OJJ07801.1 hypothetical protein ASPVEDRAFT_374904 [Aspergillus versicolor CBS 583.65]
MTAGEIPCTALWLAYPSGGMRDSANSQFIGDFHRLIQGVFLGEDLDILYLFQHSGEQASALLQKGTTDILPPPMGEYRSVGQHFLCFSFALVPKQDLSVVIRSHSCPRLRPGVDREPTTCLDSIDSTQKAAIKRMWSLLWVLNVLNWITLHGV